MERFKMTDKSTACANFLMDFREGKLGLLTFDDMKDLK
jgi:hypothetical protein